MNTDRILGIAGLVISLPGFFLILFSEALALGIAVIILSLALLAMALHQALQGEKAPFTIESLDARLEFMDPNAHVARVIKDYEVCPNFPHLTTFIHRNIGADGTISDIRWNDKPVPSSAIERVLGEHIVTVNLGTREKNRSFKGRLSYDMIDSFTKSREFMSYVVDLPTKTAWIILQFHPSKPPRNLFATVLSGGKESPFPISADPQNGSIAELSLKSPMVGAKYMITWDW